MMKINEMAKRIRVSVETLQRWDNDRTLIAHKFPKGRRYYTEDQYLNYIGVVVNEIDTIYITYKDRFVRFGYDWFENSCLKFNTKIIVLNNEKNFTRKRISR